MTVSVSELVLEKKLKGMNNGKRLPKDNSPRRRDQVSFISLLIYIPLLIYVYINIKSIKNIKKYFVNTHFIKECHLLQDSKMVLET